MQSSPRNVNAIIDPHGGFVVAARSSGLASVIDSGPGCFTLVFAEDMPDAKYMAVGMADEGYTVSERKDLTRTKSELPLAVTNTKGERTHAGFSIRIDE